MSRTKKGIEVNEMFEGRVYPEGETTEDVANEVDEALVQKNLKNEAKKEARKSAKNFVHEYMKELEKDSNLYKNLKLLIGDGLRRVTGGSRTSINVVLKEDFKENLELDEMHIFNKYKIGRPEMATKIRIFILGAKTPEERLWVQFFIDEGVYKVVGQGINPPEGWDGYIPANIESL